MSNIYLKVTIETFSKLRFSGFKKFVTSSVFGELKLTQITMNFKTSCCNLNSVVWKQNCAWLFYYLNFERNYNVLKSKSLCFLLSKKILLHIKKHYFMHFCSLFLKSSKAFIASLNSDIIKYKLICKLLV